MVTTNPHSCCMVLTQRVTVPYKTGIARYRNHPSQLRGESSFFISMFVEVPTGRLDVTFVDAVDHIRIILEIPFLVDLEIAWTPTLEVANLDKVLPPRFVGTGLNCLRNVVVRR